MVLNSSLYHIARKFRGVKFLRFLRICPRLQNFREAIFTSLIMAIGSESVTVKSRELSRMSFCENFIPRKFLAIQYVRQWGHMYLSICDVI